MNIRTAPTLITGANRGIGRALVTALLEAGAPKIYAGVRSPEMAAELAGRDSRLVPLILDITRPADIAAALAKASDVKLLVNNAGVLDFGSFIDAGPDAITRNFSVNFHGTLAMCKAFAPVLTSNGGGTMVNMLTLVALASMPSLSVYNASKAAAWSMTQSLRASLAPQNIKVMAVFPGAVDTDMLAGVEMPKTAPADIAAAILSGLERDLEDIFPDAMSQSLYAAWKADHKAVERQFAAM